MNLESTTIEPYKSRARIRLDASESHDWWHGAYLFTTNDDFLHFYFLWENQDSESAVVDVKSLRSSTASARRTRKAVGFSAERGS